MKAYALLGLVIATPALAQPSSDRSPQEAAKVALEACADHARGAIPIERKSSENLAGRGLKYQLTPPEFLASTRATVLGIGQYAKAVSSAGEIWAIGYDSGGCMVVSLDAPVADIEKGYMDYYAQAKVWRAERGASATRPGERALRYAWNPRRNLKLSALIGLRDAENTTTVTITRSTS